MRLFFVRAALAALIVSCGPTTGPAPSAGESFESTLATSKRHGTPLSSQTPKLRGPEGVSGDWTTINIPFNGSTMFLLTDGRLMVQEENLPKWHLLTPDTTGSYLHGSWVEAAPMSKGRLYYASAVLADGRVAILGGEYTGGSQQTEDNTAEIYNPVTNTWSSMPTPGWAEIGDAAGVLLADGRFLLGSLADKRTAVWDPKTNAWSDAGTKLTASDEETWVLLPNGSVLTIDCSRLKKSELWVAGKGWSEAGSLPVDIAETSSQEIGPAFLLPDGRTIFIGATGHTAVWTPGTTAPGGTWSLGPDMPHDAQGQVIAKDTPGVLLPNGHLLITGSSAGSSGWGGPTGFYDLDPKTMTFTLTTPPGNVAQPPFEGRLMLLPSGETAYVQGTGQIAFRSAVTPSIAAPVITEALSAVTAGTTMTLKGKRFNGLSQTVMYGDDAETATNYPLVQLTNVGNGAVTYARTFGHSTMGVATGEAIVSTNVAVPQGLGGGVYELRVIANAVPSAPVQITVTNTTCSAGCLTAAGFCVPGTSVDACGTGGAVCAVCGAQQACVSSVCTGGVAQDAGASDAGTVDAGQVDAGPVDAGPVDAGTVDAGTADAGQASDGGVGTDTLLVNDVPATGLGGASGSTSYFLMHVPAGKSLVRFTISGGTGDADLYVKLGGHPTATSYQCHSVRTGNTDFCSVSAPAAGDWYVMLRGYSSYAGTSLVGHAQ